MKAYNYVRMIRQPTLPGEILLSEYMTPHRITQTELAKRANVPRRRINEIIRGKRDVTPDTAHRFAILFGTAPKFWLNLQMQYDLWRVHQEKNQAYKTIKPLSR